MPINNLPSSIQAMIQQGYLDRTLDEALRAKLGFRMIAEREPFGGKIGESMIKTRTALLPASTTPLNPADNRDITSGFGSQSYGIEQYVLRVDPYGKSMGLNLMTSGVAIGNQYLLNASKLAEQATRTIDQVARNALFGAYLGGNTVVSTTEGAAGTVIHVDDIRGFYSQVGPNGTLTAVSATYPLSVTVGNGVYELVAVQADGPNPASPVDPLIVYSQVGSNTSVAFGGISGTLTFSSNVAVTDATAGQPVIASNAPLIFRPDGSLSTSGIAKGTRLSIDAILQAKSTLEANNVPAGDDGLYVCYADPLHLTGIYRDPVFQSFTRGRLDSEEYRQGAVAELLGVKIMKTNMNPTQQTSNGVVRRAIVCGVGALVEGVYTNAGNAAVQDVVRDELRTVVNGIAHVTREPIDEAKEVVTQAWRYLGGFAAPTDALTTPAVIPTATNSALKRAAIIESF
ncbi:hypothetical protein FHR90_003453 [Endobacter medicaginis]|uniref:DUF4043 domain-containing protein n=1 Tax=Endobacter medicaginis TaxID=1181271 RepID=A0A839V865_9PROT|nr:DUF4043 domain-containing protein [Endobacter medicaginis]MBB3175591.1 hypothetical protein [Endobacter medicaginis]MCX5477268.1 DUF4043 domain-containing protein [Endobacter medicaginis]NVN31137.1 DUF4043 domain-containing protein [Endobacter medicaginis]